MSIFILPYRNGSHSCNALCKELKAKRIKLRDSSFVPRMSKVVINWGNSTRVVDSYHWLNVPEAVNIAASKKSSLDYLKRAGVPCVRRINTHECINHIEEGNPVVMRDVDRGHGGAGITVCATKEDLIKYFERGGNPVLSTVYFKGREEYRVHVAADEVFDVQRKRQRADAQDVNVQVRNYDNGWVFCREGVVAPQCVLDAAVQAVAALGLDFGAVDIKYNEVADKCAVLEVNTAPGLEGTTLENYSRKLMELVQRFGV